MIEGQNILRPDEFTISSLILMNGWGLTGRGSVVSEIEPLSIKRTTFNLPVSLRGSLADQYCRLISYHNKAEGELFIKNLLFSDDDELIKIRSDEQIVIGLNSERGGYYPHW